MSLALYVREMHVSRFAAPIHNALGEGKAQALGARANKQSIVFVKVVLRIMHASFAA